MGILNDLKALIWLAALNVWATQAMAADDADGATKKKACIDAMNAQLDAPGGLDRPSFLPRAVFDVGLDMLLTALKAALKRLGFFEKLQALLP
jgi:hypothetical protein